MTVHKNEHLEKPLQEQAEALQAQGKTEGLVDIGVNLRMFIGKANEPKEVLLRYEAGEITDKVVFIGSNQSIGE